MIGIIQAFEPNEYGHGGSKRSAQLLEILSENWNLNNITVIDFKYKGSVTNKFKRTLSGFLSAKNIIKESGYSFTFKKYYKEIYKIAAAINHLKSQEQIIHSCKIIIWESTQDYWWFIPWLLQKKYNKKLICIPHNLESLVSSQEITIFNTKSQKWIEEEAHLISKGEVTFTISDEESWLLSFWGIKAYWLPYFPTSSVENELLEIRKKRENLSKTNKDNNFFLILGTAGNRPTRLGMESLIRFIEKSNNLDKFNFVIAGFDTEKYFKSNKSNFAVEGTISNERLNEILLSTSGLIINQIPTSGQICKIMEFLLAGIPVICNQQAARSYKIYDIIDFNRLEELPYILSNKTTIPDKPVKPLKQINNFINIIQEYMIS